MQVWYNTFPFILNFNFTIFCIGFLKNCSSKVWGSILLEVIINRYASSENVVVKPHLLYLSLQFNIWLFFLLSELFSHPRTPTNKSSIQKLVTKILSFGVKISLKYIFARNHSNGLHLSVLRVALVLEAGFFKVANQFIVAEQDFKISCHIFKMFFDLNECNDDQNTELTKNGKNHSNSSTSPSQKKKCYRSEPVYS